MVVGGGKQWMVWDFAVIASRRCPQTSKVHHRSFVFACGA
jgi:hypothetical protein